MNEDVLMKHITFYANLKTHFIFFFNFQLGIYSLQYGKRHNYKSFTLKHNGTCVFSRLAIVRFDSHVFYTKYNNKNSMQ